VEVVSDARMQLWLVACLLLILLRKLYDLNSPRHLARTQHVHDAVVLKTYTKTEFLNNPSVASSCLSCLKSKQKSDFLPVFCSATISHLILGSCTRTRYFSR
jgi:hypothetical protein